MTKTLDPAIAVANYQSLFNALTLLYTEMEFPSGRRDVRSVVIATAKRAIDRALLDEHHSQKE